MALARQLQPSAPLWSGASEPSAARPSDLCCIDRSPVSLSSPSSSERSESPPPHSYRRLGGPLRRLARGLAPSRPPSDDDSVPLVTPTTPSSPQCVNVGYVNESTKVDHLHNDIADAQEDHFREERENNNLSSLPGRGSPERSLRAAPWFQAGIPREIALEVLSGQPVGSFLVRGSRSQAPALALSLRVPADSSSHPAGIAHYLILRDRDKYRIKGFTKEFPSLTALVTHHSVMPELLPCVLARHCPAPPWPATGQARHCPAPPWPATGQARHCPAPPWPTTGSAHHCAALPGPTAGSVPTRYRDHLHFVDSETKRDVHR